ncbi:MAG TPA: FAD:protein FMN transferase [Bacteroidota bacterium]|nr:FAD:protein FMN transferase [Bacteroidota bacterium]
MNRRFGRRDFLRSSLRAGTGLAAALLLPLPSLASGTRSYLCRAQYVMGTIVTIEAYGESRSHCNTAMSSAFQELRRLDGLMSVYNPESQLSAVNRLAGRQMVPVDQSILDVIHHSRRFHEISGGVFDITVEPLMRIWGFRGRRSLVRPSERELDEARAAVGFCQIEVDEKNRSVGLRHPNAALDFGGIAVGYAVDRVVTILKSAGIESAFINHSGDVYALGAPNESDGWSVGLPDPLDPRRVATTLVLKDKALSTSALSEKFVEIEGKKLGHIIDPLNGQPRHDFRSLSVIASTSLEADALSTGLFFFKNDWLKGIVTQAKAITVISIDEHGVVTH